VEWQEPGIVSAVDEAVEVEACGPCANMTAAVIATKAATEINTFAAILNALLSSGTQIGSKRLYFLQGDVFA
jgi:hypothetical protein